MPKNLSRVIDKLFENIFNYARGGIAVLSLDGRWIKVNKSVINFLGYSEEELYNMLHTDITHKDDLDVNLSYVKSLLQGEAENFQMEKRYFHKNGSIVWAMLSASIVRNVKGEPLYFISQIDDISKRKADENQLEIMLNVAKEQNNRLSSFAEIVTHNLRTHVSNLMTLVTFLEEEVQSLNEDENFELLKGSVINLNQTVLHLAEVAKIKAMDESNVEVLNLYDYANQSIYNVSALAKTFIVLL